jgi:hypothetical protein
MSTAPLALKTLRCVNTWGLGNPNKKVLLLEEANRCWLWWFYFYNWKGVVNVVYAQCECINLLHDELLLALSSYKDLIVETIFLEFVLWRLENIWFRYSKKVAYEGRRSDAPSSSLIDSTISPKVKIIVFFSTSTTPSSSSSSGIWVSLNLMKCYFRGYPSRVIWVNGHFQIVITIDIVPHNTKYKAQHGLHLIDH